MNTSGIHYIRDSKGGIYEIEEENLEKALAVDDDYEYLYDYKPGVTNQAPETPMPSSPGIASQQQSSPMDTQTVDTSTQSPSQVAPQPAESNSQANVFMRDKDGGVFEIPQSNVEAAQKAGGIIVDRDGNEPAAPEPDSWGKLGARSAKTIGSEIVGSVPDTVSAIYNIPASIQNATNEVTKNDPYVIDPISGFPAPNAQSDMVPLPLIPSAADAIDSAIDKATNNYTKTEEGDSLQAALKMGTAIATPGSFAKVAAKSGKQGVAKALNTIGTTNPTGVGIGAATGAGTSEAKKAGYGTAASIGIGLGAGLGAGVAAHVGASAAKSLDIKLALAKLTGNSPKNIDMEAVHAAEKAGLDAQNTFFTKSSGLALVDQQISKTPYFGTKQAKKTQVIDQKYEQAVNEAIDDVGKKMVDSGNALDTGSMLKDTMIGTQDIVSNESQLLYRQSSSSLPKNASEIPHNVAIQFKRLKRKINKSLNPSESEKFVLNFINETESKLFSKETVPASKLSIGHDLELKYVPNDKISSASLSPIPVDRLVASKVSLNDIIDWNIATPPGAKGYLKLIQNAYLKDIASYGKTNPSWYNNFKEADSFYGKFLGDEALGSKTLRKKIFAQEDPDKILGTLTKISDFRKIEQSLATNIPNSPGAKFFDSIKREKLSDLIMGKLVDPKTGSISYGGFSKSLEDPSNKELIRYLAGDKYKDLQNLNEYAKAAVRRSRRVPNPSGTAPTKTVISSIGNVVTAGVVGGIASGITAGVTPLAGVAVLGAGLNWLVNNKTMLKWGIEGAKKQAAGDIKAANTFYNRIEKSMKKDLGEDFFKSFIASASNK